MSRGTRRFEVELVDEVFWANPDPFFDAIEEICDVTYRERWVVIAN